MERGFGDGEDGPEAMSRAGFGRGAESLETRRLE